MRFPTHQLAASAAVLFSLALLLPQGLAGDKPAAAGSLRGMVTRLGKPLPGGTIAFHGEKGGQFVTSLGPDGTFAVKEMPAGKYQVTIETESIKPRPEDKTPPKDGVRYIPIPKVYAAPKTSPLMVEVRPGQNTFDISLQ